MTKQPQTVFCLRCSQPLSAERDPVAATAYCSGCESSASVAKRGNQRVSMRRNGEGKLVYVRD